MTTPSNSDSSACPTCDLPSSLPQAQNNIHTVLCASFSSPPPKPSYPSILGLLFPSSPGSTPTPIWIPITTTTDDETSVSFQSVSTASVFPSSTPDVLYTERNTRRQRDTRSMLEIWTLSPRPPGSGIDDENESIKDLAGSTEGQGPFHAWTGPVLALAMTRATGFMVDPGTYRDMTLEDAGDVVDFLLDYGNPEHGRRVREALDTLGAETGKLDESRIADGHGDRAEGGVAGTGGQETAQRDESKDGTTCDGEPSGNVVFEVM